ncbi:SAM-dependent methyltransferase [Parabacteroides sp. PFB2-10]|uniref:class I SAM-dependent methyltransferase n=1 Tax=Parabacteroides sp. PFB2-10 TaxID=1742405 RepID=UPI00247713D8|nr:class I SAM-dependent methyltransferase [Parabacteroides sp. PFB2-10]MDH6313247.1 SAM-dependent methyltransferase [Parabacteroides sp. PFB2-10]
MQQRHLDRQQYFNEQAYTTQKYVIPFIEQQHPVTPDVVVLEIGCGEGGNMKPFLDLGCRVTGIDLSVLQIERAKEFYAAHPQKDNLTLIAEDIYRIESLPQPFDIIIMRDVIEHIPDQERFMSFVKKFMKPTGVLFIGFPPWQNPFGGHQQVVHHRFISRLPWIHLLPRRAYAALLRSGGIDPGEMLDIKSTGISLERLERIIRKEDYRIRTKSLYVINPNYEAKFKLSPRKLWKLFHIPYIRNFYTTCGYYLISMK